MSEPRNCKTPDSSLGSKAKMTPLRTSLGSRSHQRKSIRRPSVPAPGAESPSVPRLKIGVCAMEKKARAKPMQDILARITHFNEFEVVHFSDKMLLEEPVQVWPQCDCLLSWHSEGFPLKKAQQYVALHRPFCINDVIAQELLLDRRRVYKTLTDNQIPVPTHIIVSRDDLEEGVKDPPGFVEGHNWVEMDGKRIEKPFVEKPSSGDDHNVHIYYPSSMGGGVKRLFRKVDNKSSQYDPMHPGTVRRDGSYIYEEFLTTGGTDVKVYTVGPRYAHAEARKSPVVDGKVQRSADGKELRFPVLLSPHEKEISRMVTLAFGQKVCGFDLLRSERGKSFVCDVNGLSFVKNSKKYYDDAAGILRSIILNALAPHRLTTMPMLPAPVFPHVEGGSMVNVASLQDVCGLQGAEDGYEDEDIEREGNPQEELRCVLAVVRHGDRTPKQKMKMKVINQTPSLLALFDKYKDSKGKQAKLKSPEQLQDLLDVTRKLVSELELELAVPAQEGAEDNGVEAESRGSTNTLSPPSGKFGDDRDAMEEHLLRLRIILMVLEAGGHFAGVNRKVQLKPVRWFQPSSGGAANGGANTLNPERKSQTDTANGSPLVNNAPPELPQAAGEASDAPLVPSPSEDPLLPRLFPPTPLVSVGSTDNGLGSTSVTKLGSDNGAGSSGSDRVQRIVEELLLVLKWGGVLTHAGRMQAEELGNYFRFAMYPRYGPAGGGLLRLHSTYRHDLKIYSSDEGRVQMSAAAFTKGLLDLEGSSLTPILVSLVNKDASMLDAFGKGASEDMRHSKEVLYQQLTWDPVQQRSLDAPLPHTLPSLPSPPKSPVCWASGSATPTRTSTISQPLSGAAAWSSLPLGVVRRNSSRLAQQSVKSGGGSISDLSDLPAEAAGPPGPKIRGMPDQPLELLKSLAEQLRSLVGALDVLKRRQEHDSVAARIHLLSVTGDVDGCEASCPTAGLARSSQAWKHGMGKVYSSLSQAPEEWEEEAGKPCSGEAIMLMHDRWKKLLSSFYSEKKGTFDISKVPDIYDSVKHDAIHNMHLGLPGLAELYRTAKTLADVVIPNEYGLQPEDKLSVGSKVCRELLGKLLADMANMREESIATAECWEQTETTDPEAGADSIFTEFGRMCLEDESIHHQKKGALRAGLLTGSTSVPSGASGDALGEAAGMHSASVSFDGAMPAGRHDSDRATAVGDAVVARALGTAAGHLLDDEPHGDGDHEAETLHRLCPTYASDINSPLRHVRTRIYFTSESHIHSLVNVLRFCHLCPSYSGDTPLVSPEGDELLENTPEFDYLTHVVFRMYENKAVPVDAPERFRVELSLSPGSAHDPISTVPERKDHTLHAIPRMQLNLGTAETLAQMEELLAPFSAMPRSPLTMNSTQMTPRGCTLGPRSSMMPS